MISCQNAGQLTASLDLSNVTQTLESYIFLIQEDSSDPNRVQVVYPQGCYDSVNLCVKAKTCGFDSNLTSIDTQVSFDDFASNASLNLLVCAYDANGIVVASGSNTITNLDGQSVTVIMQNSSALCDGQMPGLCL